MTCRRCTSCMPSIINASPMVIDARLATHIYSQTSTPSGSTGLESDYTGARCNLSPTDNVRQLHHKRTGVRCNPSPTDNARQLHHKRAHRARSFTAHLHVHLCTCRGPSACPEIVDTVQFRNSAFDQQLLRCVGMLQWYAEILVAWYGRMYPALLCATLDV